MNDVRIAFFGSPLLALRCLEELCGSLDVRLVVTRPDKRSGRGKKIHTTPVKSFAVTRGIEVCQPLKPDESLTERLRELGIGLVVVVAYGRILPEHLLTLPSLGCLNLHASLLPRYRGPSPIEAALLNGDSETGITLQKMAPGMDEGDILDSCRIPIGSEDNAEDLLASIADSAPAFVTRSVRDYIAGGTTPKKQNEDEATYCSLIRKEDGLIRWSEPGPALLRKIRAYAVWPVAYTAFRGKRLRIYRASLTKDDEGSDAPPGTVLCADGKRGIRIATGDGSIDLVELQPENRKRMHFSEFVNGYREIEGEVLGENP